MSKRLLLSLALVILVQGSLVLALDCSKISIPNLQICTDILQSNLTLIEKEALISNLEYKNPYFPDHNYIFLRNTALTVGNAPTEVRVYDNGIIKDAWVSLFSLMPSVIYNNTLFATENIQVLTGYNYKIVLPTNYASSGYPSTDGGDCRRDYQLTSNSSENKVFINTICQGSGRVVNATLSEDSTVSAIFNVKADYSIQHYNWNEYCCRYRNGECTRYCQSCDLSNIENKRDELTLTDALSVKLYKNALKAEVIPIDSYGSTNKLRINYSDSMELDFNSSYFYFYKYLFSINYSKEPYYIFTLKAEDHHTEKINNLIRNDHDLTIKNSKDCKVRAFDLFNVIQANCNSRYLGFEFNISVDRFYYSDNQTIRVYIYPEDAQIYLTYGSQNKSATGNITFTAEYPANKISAYYGDKRYDKIIFVYNKSKLILLWKLIAFFLLVYLFCRILNVYYRRSHGG